MILLAIHVYSENILITGRLNLNFDEIRINDWLLFQAFASFDKTQSNLISLADFRRVLDIFAFKLTEPQWRHLQSRLQLVDKSVNYVLFLENYAMSDQEVR